MRQCAVMTGLRNVLLLVCILGIGACSDPELSKNQGNEGDGLKGSNSRADENPRNALHQKRAEQLGRNFISLTLGARNFSNVTIQKIDDAAIHLVEKGKVIQVGWEEVPQQVRDSWGFDVEAFDQANKTLQLEKKNLAEKEKEERETKEARINEFQKQKLLSQIEKEEAELRRLNGLLVGAENEISSLESELSRGKKNKNKGGGKGKSGGGGGGTGGGISKSKADMENDLDSAKRDRDIHKRKIDDIEAKLEKLNFQLEALNTPAEGG